MKARWKRLPLKIVVHSLLLLAVLVFLNSCQYDYNTPDPGIVQVRLKTISNNIAFDPLNNFVLKVSRIVAIREDASQLLVYEDLKSIKRTTSVYNTLDERARDSVLVIGMAYAPPGRYLGIDLEVTPADAVIRDGYRIISVQKSPDFDSKLRFREPFEIRESQTTAIKLAINLDSTLVQRANNYRFRPYYYISAIE
jgi:hypothetical protein